jgi:hypothetical protein
MREQERPPTVVLIAHEEDRLDSEGLASWLATTMTLAGIIVIRKRAARLWPVVRREIRRSGLVGFLDVMLFRLYAWLVLRPADAKWLRSELARLRDRYPVPLGDVPRVVVTDPNSEGAREFLERLRPDVIVARCKFILKPSIFRIAPIGSFALHPGICPEYRNAHGCFWALSRRDLDRVGMTLLKIDEGVDTGPVFLQATCAIDEIRESHTVIQCRVVTENLDAIGDTLRALSAGTYVRPIDTSNRRSATWGHPRLSAYLRWKQGARKYRHACNRPAALP